MKMPKISILIPVYRGEEFLETLVGFAIHNLSVSFEIIVSIDDYQKTDFHRLEAFLTKHHNVKIYLQNKQLGMNLNYDFLLSKANGEWVTIIGQDDIVLGENLDRVFKELNHAKWASETIDIISCVRSYFYWQKFSMFSIRYLNLRNSYRVKFTKNIYKKCFFMAGLLSFVQVPFLYTGNIYKREFINKMILANSNNLFNFPVPDVSTSILTNAFDYGLFKVNFPFTIVGTSKYSAGKTIGSSNQKSEVLTGRKFFDFGEYINFENAHYRFDSLVIFEYPCHRFYQFLATLSHKNLYSNKINRIYNSKWIFDWIIGQTVIEMGFNKTFRFWRKYRIPYFFSEFLFCFSVFISILAYITITFLKLLSLSVNLMTGKSHFSFHWGENQRDLTKYVNKLLNKENPQPF
jgi:glycosyltransferase involved in cell wall biosynthesis